MRSKSNAFSATYCRQKCPYCVDIYNLDDKARRERIEHCSNCEHCPDIVTAFTDMLCAYNRLFIKMQIIDTIPEVKERIYKTEQLVTNIKRGIKNGDSYNDIGKRFGLQSTTVKSIVKQYHLRDTEEVKRLKKSYTRIREYSKKKDGATNEEVC